MMTASVFLLYSVIMGEDKKDPGGISLEDQEDL